MSWILGVSSKVLERFRKLVAVARHRLWSLRLHELGSGARIAPTAIIRSPRTVRIGAGAAVGDFVHIWGGGGVEIGANSLIAAHTVIASQSHDVGAVARGLLYRDTSAAAPVRIGKNVWIASAVVIGPGVDIGDNAIVGAGSVVLRDVDEGTVVAGNPAREIRRVEL